MWFIYKNYILTFIPFRSYTMFNLNFPLLEAVVMVRDPLVGMLSCINFLHRLIVGPFLATRDQREMCIRDRYGPTHIDR